MSQGRLIALITTYTIVLVSMWVWIVAAGLEPRLGLDLQGGVSANLIPAEGQEIDDEILDQTVATIRERVDALGVAEPDIARQGDTIQVQLPGVADQEQAREIIGRTAQLQFRQVLEVIPPSGVVTPDVQVIPTELPTDLLTEQPSDGAEDAEGVEEDGTEEEGTVELEPTEVSSEQTGEATESSEEPTESEATESPESSEEPSEDPLDVGATNESDPADIGETCDERSDVSIPDPDAEVVLCQRTYDPLNPEEELPRDQWNRLRLGPVGVSGANLTDASAQIQQGQLVENWFVALEFDSEGADDFAEVTGNLACLQGAQRQLAIVLDNIVEDAPPVAQEIVCGSGIEGGEAVINSRSEAEAKDLALVLRSGALPIQLDFGTFQTVSPTLGQDSLDAGLLAGLIGLVLVAIYLVFLYRGVGLAAVLELLMFGATTYGLIILLGQWIGFTLTLAGIAGIIVSIGIAADSSIIYRERYRDEVRAGRTIRTAADHAFTKAFRTNLTGNTVSFLAAVVLYILAVGPVRGFAFTLGLSTLVDTLLFATFTRGVFGLIARSPRLVDSKLMGLRAGVTSEQLALSANVKQGRRGRGKGKGRR